MANVLDDLDSLLKERTISQMFSVEGKQWKLFTLTEGEEEWADSMSDATNSISHTRSVRAARISISIREIDGVPIETLFPVTSEVSPAFKAQVEKDPTAIRIWCAQQLLNWFKKRQSRELIFDLSGKLDTLYERKAKAETEAPK